MVFICKRSHAVLEETKWPALSQVCIHKGVFLIKFDNIHLIADNLGWFQDENWNI